MNVAAVIVAAVLAAPKPQADPFPYEGLFRLSVPAETGFEQPDTESRAVLQRAIDVLKERVSAQTRGGPVIYRYSCDRNGVIGHGVIYANPEIHARPYTPGEFKLHPASPASAEGTAED